MKKNYFFSILIAAACSHAAPQQQPASRTSEIERSNQNAQVLLDVQARFQPEGAARLGISGIDDRVGDWLPGHVQRLRAAYQQALAELKSRQASEQDPMVAQDLTILVQAAERTMRGIDLREKYEVPYFAVPRVVFGSVRALLDDQIAPDRRPAALVRVRKYAGLDEPGKPSLVQAEEAEVREGLAKGLLAPARIEVENDLHTAKFLIDGIEKLFAQYKIAGYEQPVGELKKQLEDYVKFTQEEVLPKARDDFRLPPELYQYNLELFGVDIPASELARRAHEGFGQIQGQMQEVAKRLGYADYREAIKALKKNQIPDDQVLDFYKHRLSQIEDIIRREKLVTLPNRPARIRLGTPAENAQQPAPHMSPPRLLGNTGEQGEFVLPLSVPGKAEQKYDDFNFDAAAWTLTAHEARPGHELQFDTMIEHGVPIARAVFAFNSVNVEGWGLYSEAITLPFMPDDGKLISLQLRLQRAARAFLDPELQIPGKWTPEAAREFLQKEVGLSPAFATEEVDRFTFRAPGQATSYYYGYLRLLELRAAAEKQPGFSQLAFHDKILAQGLLPPDLMKKAVLAEK